MGFLPRSNVALVQQSMLGDFEDCPACFVAVPNLRQRIFLGLMVRRQAMASRQRDIDFNSSI
jgi:hypothetical protein